MNTNEKNSEIKRSSSSSNELSDNRQCSKVNDSPKDIFLNTEEKEEESTKRLLKRLESIDDIMLLVLSFFCSGRICADNSKNEMIDADSIRNVMCVSKSWYRVACSKGLWRNVAMVAPRSISNGGRGESAAVQSLDDELIRFANLGVHYVADGRFYKALKRSTEKLFCIKAPLSLSNGYSISSQTSAILREMAMNCRIRGTCINKELKHFSLPTRVYFYQGQLLRHYHFISYTLQDLFESGKLIPPDVISIFIHQLLQGISILHGRGIIHCDLCPKSVLLKGCNNLIAINFSDVQLVLSDFSNACDIFDSSPKSTPYNWISLRYRAPELFSFNKYVSHSSTVDIWSIGCIFAEIVNNCKPIFQGESEMKQLELIIQVLGNSDFLPFHPLYSVLSHLQRMANLRKNIPHLKDPEAYLLVQLLELDPNNRINAAMALRHPYFNTISQMLETNFNDTVISLPSTSTTNQCKLTTTQHLLRMERSNTACDRRPCNQPVPRVQWAHLVDWMIEIVDVFDANPRCVYLAMDYFEQFLVFRYIGPSQYQLVAAACIHIASKCERNAASATSISISDLLFCADNTFQKDDIIHMENSILDVINFQIYNPVIFDFVTLYLEYTMPELFYPTNYTAATNKTSWMARYISDLALQSDLYRTYKPSLIAACAISLALYCLGEERNIFFSPQLHQVSGYESTDMQSCIRDLWNSIEHFRIWFSKLKMISQRYNKKEKGFVSNVRILDANELY